MIIRNPRNFSIKIFLVNIFLLKHVTADSAWFQVCDDKQKYALSSVDCEMGLWLSKPLKVNCICVNGVWVINEDLCDNNALIVVGSGDCFKLTRPIRSVKLLGKPDDPYASVSIFPKKALRRSDHEVCLVNQRSQKPVHIWKNDRRVSNRFKFIPDNKCETATSYDYNVGFGEIFQDSEVLYSDSTKPDCSKKCIAAPLELSQKRPAGRNYGRGLGRGISSSKRSNTNSNSKQPNENIQWRNLYATNRKVEFENGGDLNEAQRTYKMNLYNYRYNFTILPLSHSREVREQSVRMVQAQTNFLLLHQTPPRINSPEYDYFQKLRQVFVGVVPHDIINHDIVTGLMRMFRVLLWESHDKFQYQENPNPEQYERIMRPLNECIWNVTAYPFVFTDWVNNNTEAKPRAHSTHPCLERTENVYWNDSNQKVAGGGDLPAGVVNFINTNENMIGPREPFNLTYDFVIETAWKIYLFGFYRCNEYFNEQPTDAHELAERVQSLFNPRVTKRWYQPEDFNKVLPLIFPKLNLTQFAWAVDKMTMGARDSPSTYSDLLQKRPAYMSQEDIPHDTSLSDLKKDKGRRKRSPRKQKFRQEAFWSNRAHCMFSYSDPIHQFKHSGKQGCYIGQAK
ncbi:unnamed protein product [Allacma fusca]|uniref:Uncharacterized protein n=1 Tax=Allacma fusca TaxID=39272 RepID=A0A8J2LJB9_9HEXA|nr:unnamed protein product [Allacma fusca]